MTDDLIIGEKDYLALQNNRVKTLRKGGGSRAEIYHVSFQGKELVVKDYNPCNAFMKNGMAPILIAREVQKLKQLSKVEGIPNWRGNFPKVLVIDYVDAVTPSDKTFTPENWQYFEQKLSQLINDMHAAGVAHADLRSPGNVLVTADYNPVIVDFVASVSKSKLSLATNLFNKVKKIDLTAILKIKKFVVPDLLTEQEWNQYHQDKTRAKTFRAIIDNGRKLVQKK